MTIHDDLDAKSSSERSDGQTSLPDDRLNEIGGLFREGNYDSAGRWADDLIEALREARAENEGLRDRLARADEWAGPVESLVSTYRNLRMDTAEDQELLNRATHLAESSLAHLRAALGGGNG